MYCTKLIHNIRRQEIASKFIGKSLSFSSNISNSILEVHPTISGVCNLILTNHTKKNAFTKEFVEELNEILDDVRQDTSIRCMIIKSNVPKIFCAGADLKERKEMKNEEVGPFVSYLRSTLNKVSNLRFPTIAVIEGIAFGGGLELALACDIRIAGMDAVLGLTETSLAVIPGAGGTQRLPRLIGMAKAKEFIFTGARLSSMEAEKVGIVQHCVPTGEAVKKAEEIAISITEKGPIAIRMAKLAIDKGLQVDIDAGMEFEKLCYDEIIPTQDRIEGLTAFIEKRKPSYIGE